MKGVTESMAGRAAILQLLPLSITEAPKVSVFRGGFPEVLARPSSARLWFQSYVQTYLEPDVRAVTAIRDLSTFRRFLALVASRAGQMLNKTDLAGPLGVSVPTITEWLSILEITGQILLVPPYFENFGKRLVKSPKLYFVDSGPKPEMAEPMQRLLRSMQGYEATGYLVHPPSDATTSAILPGIHAADVTQFLAKLRSR